VESQAREGGAYLSPPEHGEGVTRRGQAQEQGGLAAASELRFLRASTSAETWLVIRFVESESPSFTAQVVSNFRYRLCADNPECASCHQHYRGHVTSSIRQPPLIASSWLPP